MSQTSSSQDPLPIPLNIIVTGVKSSQRATEVHNILRAYADHAPGFTVEVLHFCTTPEEVERSGVTELDWLLFNAATSLYICHVDHANLGNFRATSFDQLKLVIAKFERTHNAATLLRQKAGRVQVPFDDVVVQGCEKLYFNAHNNTRALRYMDSQFTSHLPRMAYLVPMTLRGVKDRKNVPILRALVPSLKHTLSHTQMDRGLYLGIDEDELIEPRLMDIITNQFESTLGIRHEATLKFPAAWRKDKNMARMYNALFQRAMMDGYEFAVQLQDDARLETPRWDRTLGAHLCSNPLAAGAYSLCDRYDPDRMENTVVSRTHFDIFGYMFDPRAPDSSAWIKRVMGAYAKVVGNIKVTNTIKRERRRRNGTVRVHEARGDVDEAVEDEARRQFVGRYVKKYV